MLLAAIGDTVDRAFTVFFAWLPHVVGAIAVLVIGFFVAKLVAGLVWRGLQRAGFDRTLHSSMGGSYVRRLTTSPSRLVGTLAFWAVVLGTVSLAVSVLGVDALKDVVAAVFAYLPNVLAAFAIFLVAGAVATGIATLARRTMGDTALGTIVATAGPILVMTIATFMILDQLMIAQDIVVITYAGLIGAVALASALAFGLGGRDVARELLQNAYETGRRHKDEFTRDLDTGLSRARTDRNGETETVVSDGDGELTAEDTTRRLETPRRRGTR
jgi:hypothetical protein